MIIFNSSNQVEANRDGQVTIGSFEVKAGEEAYLTLTAHEAAKGRFEIPIYRVSGHCGSSCPAAEGAVIRTHYQVDGLLAFLGNHKAADKLVMDRCMINWPGKYLLQMSAVESLSNPCEPIVVELHKMKRYDDTTPA